ncbi:MAG: hypothetical protein ABGZ36_15145, partial [Actinomycetota bacterium]
MSWSTRLRERLPAPVLATVDLAVATVKDAGRDRVPGLAAEISFWMLLSLPPLLLTVVASAGFIGEVLGTDVEVQLIARLEQISLQVFTDATVEETIR